MAALPARWRPVAVVLAALVGIGRIVHGVHLPADVTGGWALGTLLGLGAVLLVDRLRPKESET
jgi:membrane-associated phospholipid phosphatase